MLSGYSRANSKSNNHHSEQHQFSTLKAPVRCETFDYFSEY